MSIKMYRLVVLGAAVAMTSAVGMAQQQSGQTTESPTTAKAEDSSAKSPLSLSAEVAYTTAYYSRGYNDAFDAEFILQPQATVGYEIYNQNDWVIVPWVNVWADVTDRLYPGVNYWDELDLVGGVSFTYKRLTLTPQYLYYHSMGKTWSDTNALGLQGSVDDSGLLGDCPVALNPNFFLYCQTANQGGPNGSVIELGLAPSYSPIKDVPLKFSLPMNVGINIQDYYFTQNGGAAPIGYWSVGAKVNYNITSHWYTYAAVTYIQLSAASTKASNGGESTDAGYIGGSNHDVYGTIAIGYTF